MARQPPNSESNREIIPEARKFYTRFGMDLREASKILLGQNRPGDISTNHPDHKKIIERNEETLSTALLNLPPESVLELLHSEDLELLHNRFCLVDQIKNKRIPFYSIGDYEKHIKLFLNNMDENRNHLLQTGYPNFIIKDSTLLDPVLQRLYFTKIPFIKSALNRGESELAFEYGWGKKSLRRYELTRTLLYNNWTERNAKGLKIYKVSIKGKELNLVYNPLIFALTETEGNIDTCLYQSAMLIDGISSEEQDWIVGIRNLIFELKYLILRKILNILREKEPRSVIDECFKIIKEKIPDTEVISHLLDVDEIYIRFNQKDLELPFIRAGGFSDILLTIGELNRKIISGTSLLNPLLNLFKRAGIFGDAEGTPIGYYFQLLRFNQREYVNDIIDSIRSELNYNFDYQKNFFGIVAQKLSDWNTAIIHVDKKFEKLVVNYIRALSKTDQSEIDSIATNRNYDFVKHGNTWEVYFNGTRSVFQHISGLAYIAILLENPNEKVDVNRLISLAGKCLLPGLELKTREFEHKTDEELERYGMHQIRNNSKQPIANQKTKGSLIELIKELRVDLEKARKEGNEFYINEIEEDLKNRKRDLNAIVDRKGKLRNFRDSGSEKNRNIVRKAIDRALARISESDGHLHKHLNDSIEKGSSCIYKNNENIIWNVSY